MIMVELKDDARCEILRFAIASIARERERARSKRSMVDVQLRFGGRLQYY